MNNGGATMSQGQADGASTGRRPQQAPAPPLSATTLELQRVEQEIAAQRELQRTRADIERGQRQLRLQKILADIASAKQEVEAAARARAAEATRVQAETLEKERRAIEALRAEIREKRIEHEKAELQQRQREWLLTQMQQEIEQLEAQHTLQRLDEEELQLAAAANAVRAVTLEKQQQRQQQQQEAEQRKQQALLDEVARKEALVLQMELMKALEATPVDVPLYIDEIDWSGQSAAWNEKRDFEATKYKLSEAFPEVLEPAHTKCQQLTFMGKPFAKGAFRFAFACIALGSKSGPSTEFVLKRMMWPGVPLKFQWSSLQATVMCHLLAGKVAAAFNAKKPELAKSVQFVNMLILQDKSDPSFLWTLENRIPGNYVKYTNNAEYVSSTAPDEILALSHFSFEFYRRQRLLVDLQGVLTKNGYVLTDPAFHSTVDGVSVGVTNSGANGFREFFKVHKCTFVCTQMGLKIPAVLD